MFSADLVEGCNKKAGTVLKDSAPEFVTGMTTGELQLSQCWTPVQRTQGGGVTQEHTVVLAVELHS